ncbi:MAG: dockerin type I repeat-containing protein [Oscillospiraceae bacterium]|nr:dockerin type I repeat-containing protein [Oscillospiraceae bacterium]
MKKIILTAIGLILALCAVMFFAFSGSAKEQMLGDVSGDGEISADDARLVLRYVAKLQDLTEEQKKAADVDNDGVIDAADARLILRVVAKLDSGEIDKNDGNVIWKEVPIGPELTAMACGLEFDLREKIMESDYVFSGEIVSIKEFEHSYWNSVYKEMIGPFQRTVIEVKLNKEYHGKSPVQGDTIKLLVTYSSSWIFQNDIRFKEGYEYVFVTKILDEKYYEDSKKSHPPGDTVVNFNEYAEVVLNGGGWDALSPIVDGNVIVYHEYFEEEYYYQRGENPKSKTVSPESVRTELLTTPESLEMGYFIALKLDDFEKEFLKLYENPEKLPTKKSIS